MRQTVLLEWEGGRIGGSDEPDKRFQEEIDASSKAAEAIAVKNGNHNNP